MSGCGVTQAGFRQTTISIPSMKKYNHIYTKNYTFCDIGVMEAFNKNKVSILGHSPELETIDIFITNQIYHER